MKRVAIALVIAIAAACGGSSHSATPDGSAPPSPDASLPDGSIPPAATFTSFVIDLVVNQTASTTDPQPYSAFQALPDPDGSNGSAYSSLF